MRVSALFGLCRPVFLSLFVSVSVNSLAQTSEGVGINNDGSDPDPSAILDVKSGDKGLLIPRVANTAAVSAPANSLMIFDESDQKFKYYDAAGAQWVELGTGSGDDGDWTISGSDLTFLGGNVGIGIANPAAALDVDGTIRVNGFEMPGGATAGYVLTANSSGQATWQAIPVVADGNGIYSGGGALSGNTTVTNGSAELKFKKSTSAPAISIRYDGTGSSTHLSLDQENGSNSSSQVNWNFGPEGSETMSHQIVGYAPSYTTVPQRSGKLELSGEEGLYLNLANPAGQTKEVVIADNGSQVGKWTADGLVVGTGSPDGELDVEGKTITENLQITDGAIDGYLLSSDAAGNVEWINPASVVAGADGNGLYDGGNSQSIPDGTNPGLAGTLTIGSSDLHVQNGFVGVNTTAQLGQEGLRVSGESWANKIVGSAGNVDNTQALGQLNALSNQSGIGGSSILYFADRDAQWKSWIKGGDANLTFGVSSNITTGSDMARMDYMDSNTGKFIVGGNTWWTGTGASNSIITARNGAYFNPKFFSAVDDRQNASVNLFYSELMADDGNGGSQLGGYFSIGAVANTHTTSSAAGRVQLYASENASIFDFSSRATNGMRFSTMGQSRVTVLPTGEVGIGTITPETGKKLHVNGDTKLEGDFSIVDGTEGADKVLVSDANGNASWTDPLTLNVVGDGNGIYSGSGSLGGNTAIAGGSLGIGYSDPADIEAGAVLDVNGKIVSSTDITAERHLRAQGDIYVESTSGSQENSHLIIGGDGKRSYTFIENRTNGNAYNGVEPGDMVHRIDGGGDWTWSKFTAPQMTLTSNANGPALGIGITKGDMSGAYGLEVDGAANFDGRVDANGDVNAADDVNAVGDLTVNPVAGSQVNSHLVMKGDGNAAYTFMEHRTDGTAYNGVSPGDMVYRIDGGKDMHWSNFTSVRMTLKNGGTLGIGHDPADINSAYKLDVDGAGRFTGDALVEGKTTTDNFKMTNGAGANKVLVSDADGDASWEDASTLTVSGDGDGLFDGGSDEIPDGTNPTLGGGLTFGSNDLHVENNFVGVGVTSPTDVEEFKVQGDAVIRKLMVGSNVDEEGSSFPTTPLNIFGSTTGTASGPSMGFYDAAGNYPAIIGTGNQTMLFEVNAGFTSTHQAAQLQFMGSNTSRLTVGGQVDQALATTGNGIITAQNTSFSNPRFFSAVDSRDDAAINAFNMYGKTDASTLDRLLFLCGFGYDSPVLPGGVELHSTAATDFLAIASESTNGIVLKTGSGNPMNRVRVTSAGLVGVGTDTPTEEFDVVGDVRLRGLAGTGTRMVVADDNGILQTTAVPTGGDGNGLYDGGSQEIPTGTNPTLEGDLTFGTNDLQIEDDFVGVNDAAQIGNSALSVDGRITTGRHLIYTGGTPTNITNSVFYNDMEVAVIDDVVGSGRTGKIAFFDAQGYYPATISSTHGKFNFFASGDPTTSYKVWEMGRLSNIMGSLSTGTPSTAASISIRNADVSTGHNILNVEVDSDKGQGRSFWKARNSSNNLTSFVDFGVYSYDFGHPTVVPEIANRAIWTLGGITEGRFTYGNTTKGMAFGLTTAGTPSLRLDDAGSVAVNADVADASAILDVSSTNKGFLLPRMTEAERDLIGSPATGLEVFNTTTNAFNYYDGTSWVEVAAGGSGSDLNGIYGASGVLSGNTVVDITDNELNFQGNGAGRQEMFMTNSSQDGVNYLWTTVGGNGYGGGAGAETNMIIGAHGATADIGWDASYQSKSFMVTSGGTRTHRDVYRQSKNLTHAWEVVNDNAALTSPEVELAMNGYGNFGIHTSPTSQVPLLIETTSSPHNRGAGLDIKSHDAGIDFQANIGFSDSNYDYKAHIGADRVAAFSNTRGMKISYMSGTVCCATTAAFGSVGNNMASLALGRAADVATPGGGNLNSMLYMRSDIAGGVVQNDNFGLFDRANDNAAAHMRWRTHLSAGTLGEILSLRWYSHDYSTSNANFTAHRKLKSGFDVYGRGMFFNIGQASEGFEIGKWQSSNWTNLFKVDAATDRVAIGSVSPTSRLHVQASSGLGTLTLEKSDGNYIFLKTDDDKVSGIYSSSSTNTYKAAIEFNNNTPTGTENLNGITFKSGNGGGTGNVKMMVTGAGNVGIGTGAKAVNVDTKLHVQGGDVKVEDGEVYITDKTKGIVMRGDDDQCYRITVVGGALSVGSSFTCP